MTPTTRFFQLMRLDAWELLILSCYALLSGLLALAVPLASQALVNNLAQGLLWQPLLVLTAAVLLGLLVSGTLKALQFSLAETVQQRLFAQLGLRLTELLPQFDYRAFVRHHGPQELNKFFEIVNLQKSWNKLLLAVPSGLVEAALSLTFLAFYGTDILTLCLLALIGATLLLIGLGLGGLRSSLRASTAKYELAGWLEQIGRSQAVLQISRISRYLLARSDAHVAEYLRQRQAHYRVLLRQLFAFYSYQAVVSAAVLGLGGWLVIQRQISLGQLVAIELVVLNLLKAGEKLVSSLDSFYAVLTALSKLDHLLGLPLNPSGTDSLPDSTRGAELLVNDVWHEHTPGQKLLSGCEMHIQANERVSVIAAEGAGRTTLALLCLGLVSPRRGAVLLDGVRIGSLKQMEVGWIREEQELLNTTVEDNIRLGRSLSPHDLRWAVRLSGLQEHLPRLADGLQTAVECGGENLSSSQRLRVLLARTVAMRPRLLVIDHDLHALDFEHRIETLNALYDRQHRWTLLNLVSDTESLALSDRVLWLADGKLIDLGTPHQALESESFVQTFPKLSSRLRSRLEVG